MFLSLISGSSGNATLVKYKNTTLLIDCGMSGKKLEQAIGDISMTCFDIDALLITHEHIDHTRGAGVISRKYNIPLYMTKGTHLSSDLGKIPSENINYISKDSQFEIGDIGIVPFEISHDAKEPVGYSFYTDKKLTLATDCGVLTEDIQKHLLGSDEIILESNHDPDLLMYGAYPMSLKRRIMSDLGHLSNMDAAKMAVKLLNSGTKKIMLGHLSQENNTPDIAYETTKNALIYEGARLGEDISLSVANRYEITRF